MSNVLRPTRQWHTNSGGMLLAQRRLTLWKDMFGQTAAQYHYMVEYTTNQIKKCAWLMSINNKSHSWTSLQTHCQRIRDLTDLLMRTFIFGLYNIGKSRPAVGVLLLCAVSLQLSVQWLHPCAVSAGPLADPNIQPGVTMGDRLTSRVHMPSSHLRRLLCRGWSSAMAHYGFPKYCLECVVR